MHCPPPLPQQPVLERISKPCGNGANDFLEGSWGGLLAVARPHPHPHQAAERSDCSEPRRAAARRLDRPWASLSPGPGAGVCVLAGVGRWRGGPVLFQILALLASSPWHPEPACLIPTTQGSNSQLSALSWPVRSPSPRSWVGTAPEGQEVEGAWAPPRGSRAPERRGLRSRKVPRGGARTCADAGEAAQGGFRPCECVHGRLCVSVFLYMCVRVRGCLGGMYSGLRAWRTPQPGTSSGFLIRRILDRLPCMWAWGGGGLFIVACARHSL